LGGSSELDKLHPDDKTVMGLSEVADNWGFRHPGGPSTKVLALRELILPPRLSVIAAPPGVSSGIPCSLAPEIHVLAYMRTGQPQGKAD
jgi:hypothetical protein